LKIRACIPFYSEFETAKSGLLELSYCESIDFKIEPRQGSVTRRNRNSLINDMRSQNIYQEPVKGFDYFLMIDSDISFKLDDVLKLIAHDKDIICAPYVTHDSESKIYDCGMFLPGQPGRIMLKHTIGERGLKKIDWAGAGFTLMKASIFEKIPYPWYRHLIVEDNGKAEESSEDIGFFVNARNQGFDLWCDFDVKIGHRRRKHTDFNWDLK